MNRIEQKFVELRKNKKKAFIAFITAGDPSLDKTYELVLAFEKAGVDIIELGVPFSDPLADGPTIQAASQRALQQGVNLDKILQLVKRLRAKTEIPLALMTYYNPVFHLGEKRFIESAHQSGVDGVIIPDLPPEEAKTLCQLAKAKNISTVFFVSPTTTKHRMKKNIQASSGFVYYVSLTGVTGAKQQLPATIAQQIRLAKSMTTKPVCVGFGISDASQVKSVGKVADGVIVGSAIVQKIFQSRDRQDLVSHVVQFVAHLRKALD
jgi:tryptophan synthase alpha chain